MKNSGDYETGSSYTTTALADGGTSMTIQAVDAAGNLSEESNALSVTIDTTHAAVGALDLQAASDTGVSNTDNITNITTPHFDITVTGLDIGGPSYGLSFYVDYSGEGTLIAGSWAKAGDIYTFTPSVALSSYENYTVVAMDTAGNESAGAELGVWIDTAAPAAPGAPDLQAASDSGVSSADNYSNDNTPTFTVTSTGAYFRFFVSNVQSGGDYLTGSSWTTTALADGPSFMTVMAVDAAGNISTASIPLVVLIDTVAPIAPGAPDLQAASDSGVSNSDNITNDNTPTFDVTSTDSYFRFYVNGAQDGGDYLTGSSYTVTALTDGAKAMTIRAVDFAGNLSGMSEVNIITVDTQEPTSGIITASHSQGSVSMNLQWTAANSPQGGEGIAGITIYVSTDGVTYNAAFENLTSSQTSVTYVAHDAAAGAGYSFYSIATDLAGNEEAAPPVPDATIILWDTEEFAIPLNSRGRGSYRFYDANGTYVTVSWAGPSASVVTVERWLNPLRSDPVNPDTRSDIRNITIDGSSATSRLTITTRASRDYPGSDAGTTVENITSTSPLGVITARTVDLMGNIDIEGSLSWLIMDDTVGKDQRIDLGASSNPRNRAYIIFDEVSDLSINSDTAIGLLRVTRWLDTDEEVDLITAPSIAALTVNGNRRALITGDFDASIDLTGALLQGACALGTARITGSLRNATWNIEGVLNRLIINRWLDSSRILTTQRINTVQIGGARHSDIYAGIDTGVTGLPDPNEDFSVAQSLGVNSVINNVRITGVVINDGFSAIDSNIAAMRLNTVSLRNAEFANNGTLWGLAAVNLPVRLIHRDITGLHVYPFGHDPDFEVRVADGVPR